LGVASVRVASLTPSNTEILAFLDRIDTLVACDDFSDWPPEASQAAALGPDLQIDVDRLAAMDTDLVLASESVPGMEEVNDQVEEAGLRCLVLAPTTIEDVLDDVQTVAEALDVPERGARLAEAMQAGLAAVDDGLGEVEPVDVYWEWWPNPPITPGAGGWMDEVIARAGGRNVFGDREEQSLEVSRAEVEAADPDVVGLCWQGTLAGKESLELLAKRDEGAWSDLRAVEAGRVQPFPEALYGRPGPRLVEGIRGLAAELHPERADKLPQAWAWVPNDLKGKLPLSGP
jgi:iron complex transport system substrate-binding protein